MFKRLPDGEATPAKLTVDGRTIEARAGDSIAAALLAAGVSSTRLSSVGQSPRAPYCMMGVCFECMVIVDGVANRQGCLVPVRDGMEIVTLMGRREIGA
ncbi:MAG: (2Fe-2S)-binding protein [Hyphomicrobiaceae bacterium]